PGHRTAGNSHRPAVRQDQARGGQCVHGMPGRQSRPSTPSYRPGCETAVGDATAQGGAPEKIRSTLTGVHRNAERATVIHRTPVAHMTQVANVSIVTWWQ